MNAVYNISILSLASRLFSISPLVCNHYTAFSRQVTIQNSYFQKYISPIYSSFESLTNFSIHSSVIQNSLDQAIHVDRNIQWTDQQFFSPINSFKEPFEKIYVKNCKFISIKSQFCSGGAIQSFSSLFINDCSFERCKTIRGGGAIASYSELIMNDVIIQHCEALYSASIFSDSFHRVKAFLESVSSYRCKALMSNGAITVKSSTDFLFSYSNLSNCENDGFYCGIWIDKSYVNVSFSYFTQNRNPDINGAVASIFTNSVFIDHTAFIDLKLKSRNNFGAVAIYIDRNLDRNSTISNCIFKYPDTLSPSIHVRLGMPVNVSSCCFSNSQNIELRNYLSKFQKDNVFGFQCELNKIKKKKSDIEELIYKSVERYSRNNTSFKKILDDKTYTFYCTSPLLFAIIFSILFLII